MSELLSPPHPGAFFRVLTRAHAPSAPPPRHLASMRHLHRHAPRHRHLPLPGAAGAIADARGRDQAVWVVQRRRGGAAGGRLRGTRQGFAQNHAGGTWMKGMKGWDSARTLGTARVLRGDTQLERRDKG